MLGPPAGGAYAPVTKLVTGKLPSDTRLQRALSMIEPPSGVML